MEAKKQEGWQLRLIYCRGADQGDLRYIRLLILSHR